MRGCGCVSDVSGEPTPCTLPHAPHPHPPTAPPTPRIPTHPPLPPTPPPHTPGTLTTNQMSAVQLLAFGTSLRDLRCLEVSGSTYDPDGGSVQGVARLDKALEVGGGGVGGGVGGGAGGGGG